MKLFYNKLKILPLNVNKMIDTIKGYINLSEYKYEDVKHLLNEGTINKSKNTFAFNLLNFRFTIKFDEFQNPIKLSFNGSLPKYHHGNNLAQLGWETIEKAINELSDNLNINLSEATLSRIDIAVNLVLEKPINQYIHNFYKNRNSGMIIYDTSKTFLSKTTDISFYDKLEEIKKNDKHTFKMISDPLKDKNILRYELRLKKNLKHYFNLNEFTIKDLFKKNIQHNIVDLWVKHYSNVNKHLILDAPKLLLSKRNGLKEYLSYTGLKTIGIERTFQVIQSTNFPIKDIYSKRSKMKKSLNKFIQEIENDLLEENIMTELHDKIILLSKILKE